MMSTVEVIKGAGGFRAIVTHSQLDDGRPVEHITCEVVEQVELALIDEDRGTEHCFA